MWEGISIVANPLITDNSWRARKVIIFPLRASSLCELVRRRDAQGHPTLGLFKPKAIDCLTITPESPVWTPNQIDALRQGHLFLRKPERELEKIPFSFSYEFRCDDTACSGHKMICTDWEIGEAYRKWKAEYGSQWEQKFRQRFESDMISKYDTHFYVGTVHRYPSTWIIVGLFYPPFQGETGQAELFH